MAFDIKDSAQNLPCVPEIFLTLPKTVYTKFFAESWASFPAKINFSFAEKQYQEQAQMLSDFAYFLKDAYYAKCHSRHNSSRNANTKKNGR